MCACKNKSAGQSPQQNWVPNNVNCKPISYYEDLLLTAEGFRKQLIQSQINIYYKDCAMFLNEIG